MRKVATSIVIAAVVLLSVQQVACATEHAASPEPEVRSLENPSPGRILFVGNSYLYYNDSLHNHVERIAEELRPNEKGGYQFKSATIGGARLSHHPIDTLLEPGRLDVDEPFELVVLQGASDETLTDDGRVQFRKLAIEMSQKIRATGAEVALYMTHAYVEPDDRYAPNLIDTIAPAYVSVGNELDALVIPVGLAFERAYAQRSDIELHKSFDGSHPSLLGTYLAACVVYQSIYVGSTEDVTYDYFGAIAEEDAEFLQRVADETVREFYSRD